MAKVVNVKSEAELDLKGKVVLIRSDLNVPMDDAGNITSEKRIIASLEAYKVAMNKGAKAIIIMSHLGQPEAESFEEKFSLRPVAERVAKLLEKPVRLIRDWTADLNLKEGEIVMLENVRFNKGEKKNNDDLAKQYAALADIFVNDAFATAHRAQASTHGVAKYAKVACAGPLMLAELEALTKALEKPEHPLVAIVGGSKVSTKLQILESLVNKVDQLIVGGGIANTFMAALGLPIGKSLFEADLIPQAKSIIETAKKRGAEIPIPVDVVVAKEFDKEAKATVKKVADVAQDDMILDFGPETTKRLVAILAKAKSIVWNGPIGVFEFDQFAAGTKALSEAVANSGAFSIAGGGDTIAAISKFGVTKKISYISTAGGAFLEFLQGDKLPAVAILEERA